MSVAYVADPDVARCHALHLHGLVSDAPWVQPSYARRDADLRAAMPKTGRGPKDPDFGALACIFTTSEPPQTDRAWFEKRWSLGEEETAREHAKRLAQEAGTIPIAAVMSGAGPVRVTASPVLRWGFGSDAGDAVVAGYRNSGYMVALAVVGAALRSDVPVFPELTQGLRHRLELHLAATVCLKIPAFAPHIDKLLETAGGLLRPARGSEDAARRELERLAETCLDQPAGEIGRIGSGLHQGRVDRLHRAWERGFFVPQGFDLEGWVSARTSISCGPAPGSLPYPGGEKPTKNPSQEPST